MGLFFNIREKTIGRPGIWHLTETADELLLLHPPDAEEKNTLASFSHEQRKKEWLSARILTARLSEEKQVKIRYDLHNKPSLEGLPFYISISHSGPLLAVILSEKETGIDIETVKPNVQRIRHKFMSENELDEAGHLCNDQSLTLYWCVKESLYKFYGKKELTFKEHLFVEPFTMQKEGSVFGRILHPSMNKRLRLNYSTLHAEEKTFILAYIVGEES